MRFRRIAIALSTCILVAQTTAYAWNSTGHRAVAYIAYKQLKEKDPATLQRVLNVLKMHPGASTDLWTNGGINGTDADLNLFLNAATFPDDVRTGHITPHTRFKDDAFANFQHSNDHFINLRYVPPDTDPQGTASGGTLAPSYAARVKAVRDNNPGDLKNGDGTPEARAVSLSWIFHQIGDVHQPLHAAARFSDHFNHQHGDEGGNLVRLVPSRRGATEFHAFWDGLLGGDEEVDTPQEIASVGDGVRSAVPTGSFSADDLKPADDLKAWAMESYRLAVEKAYGPLSDKLDGANGVSTFPPTYTDDAINIANRRVAQAGYRLASELQALFPVPDPNN